jgi:hypothetical protein
VVTVCSERPRGSNDGTGAPNLAVVGKVALIGSGWRSGRGELAEVGNCGCPGFDEFAAQAAPIVQIWCTRKRCWYARRDAILICRSLSIDMHVCRGKRPN